MQKLSPSVAQKDGRQRLRLSACLLAILTAVLWGGNPVAVSFSVDTLPPIAVAAVRFSMATAFMYFWCCWEKCGLRLASDQWIPVLLAGFGLFIQIALFNVGVVMSNSSHGAMLIPTYVFWVNLLEHFVTRSDHLTRRKLAGLGLAFFGVALVLSAGGRTPVADTQLDAATVSGDLILLASAVVLAVKVVYVKHAVKRVPPGRLIFWHDLVGVVLFSGCSMLFEQVSAGAFTPTVLLALLYQGVFVAGVCFAVQARLLVRYSASQIAVFSFVTPICGVLFAVLLRGDSLSPWLIVSTVCVAAGIWIIQTRGTPTG